MVEAYREAYKYWAETMEEVCIGYRTEELEYRKNNPPPLFKDWLQLWKGMQDE